MKYLVILSAVVSLSLLLCGLYFDWAENPLKDKFYGFGTIGIFLITFPLFLFWRRNKVDIKKYMWRNESAEDIKKTDE